MCLAGRVSVGVSQREGWEKRFSKIGMEMGSWRQGEGLDHLYIIHQKSSVYVGIVYRSERMAKTRLYYTNRPPDTSQTLIQQ
jgi:hypothetical protein